MSMSAHPLWCCDRPPSTLHCMTVPVPENWKLSKAIRDELPAHERDTAVTMLWQKSGGICALCAEPLPADGKGVDVDHKIARTEGQGGETKLVNLFLAHRGCN